jgi:hypothetical protein
MVGKGKKNRARRITISNLFHALLLLLEQFLGIVPRGFREFKKPVQLSVN